MKAHLATLPLPPKVQQLGNRTESASSSSSSSDEEEDDQEQQQQQQQLGEIEAEAEEKCLIYGLRENPKRSFKFADPEFSFAVDSGSVIQDRESETESKNPTRRRSKRNRRPIVAEIEKQNLELKKPKLRKPSSAESYSPVPEPEQVSSVSDTSPEEDVAMCLIMLSRDVWMRNNEEEEDRELGKESVRRSMKKEGLEEIKLKKVRAKHRCEKCKKVFRSYQALCGHKKICCVGNEAEAKNGNLAAAAAANEKLFECPFCYKVFGSGQALGGHKRSHLLNASTTTTATSSSGIMNSVKLRESFIDLNLPAPLEEDDFSVLSDA